MSSTLELILIWTIFGSVAGLVGGIALLSKEKWARKKSIYFVSFAAGALLATVFLDFLPELLAQEVAESTFIWSLGGILLFFVLEKLFFWHHHHAGKEVHIFTYSILIGDTVHNFIDGMIIAASFLISPQLGVIAAIAVFFHEIPQEMADFGVLLHGGMSRAKVFTYNLFSAFAAVLGALISFYYSSSTQLTSALVAFAAGMFIYIAVIDLIPQTYKERKKNLKHLILFLIGVLVMWLVGIIVPE